MGNEEIVQVVVQQPIEVKAQQEPPYCQVQMLQAAKAIEITQPNNHQEENFLKEIYNRNRNSISQASLAPKDHHSHRASLQMARKSKNRLSAVALHQQEIPEADKENTVEKTPQRSKRSSGDPYHCTIEDCESVQGKQRKQ